MRGSRSEEDSRSLFRLLRLGQLKGIAVDEVVGYSIRRILLVGLFFPAVVVSTAMAALALSLVFHLSLGAAFFLVFVATMGGFALGTFTLIRLTERILAFARRRN